MTWLSPGGSPMIHSVSGSAVRISTLALKELRMIWSVSRMTRTRSTALNSLLICLREKCSKPSTSRAPRFTEEWMRSVISSRDGSPLWLNWISWLLTRISVRVFLKLWATPAAMVPMASIFCTCWSCISRRLRSVMSVIISITVDSSPFTGSFFTSSCRPFSSSGLFSPISAGWPGSVAKSAESRSRIAPANRSGGCAVSIRCEGMPSITMAAELA